MLILIFLHVLFDLLLQYECTKAALDAGCNFLDNAEVYCNGEAETCMGNVLKRLNVPRSQLVISTKIFWGGSGTLKGSSCFGLLFGFAHAQGNRRQRAWPLAQAHHRGNLRLAEAPAVGLCRSPVLPPYGHTSSHRSSSSLLADTRRCRMKVLMNSRRWRRS